jgi:hypothetical protein
VAEQPKPKADKPKTIAKPGPKDPEDAVPPKVKTPPPVTAPTGAKPNPY